MYKLLDKNNNEIKLYDLQEKGFWCEHGFTKEKAFVEKFGSKMGVILNPEKDTSPYVPDLYQNHNGKLADLKTQNTPMFQSKQRYGIAPQYAVTFNLKDYERYSKLYGDIAIYFCIDWVATSFVSNSNRVTSVRPMKGIWWIDMARIHQLVKKAPVHSYQQRVDDTKGNAKASYVFDLQDPLFTKII